MTGVVASIVQAFYAYRVYVVSKRSLALPILITFFSPVQLGAFSRSLHRRLPVLTLRRPGFACGATGMVFKLKDFAKFQSWTCGGEERAGGAEVAIDNLSPSPTLPSPFHFLSVTIWLVSAAVCDILITGSLVFHLRKSKTGMLQTNSCAVSRIPELRCRG